MKCECGGKRRETKEPCFFNDNCHGCALCKKGLITIVYCDNPDCIFGVDFDDE